MTINETTVWIHRRTEIDQFSAKRVMIAGQEAVRYWRNEGAAYSGLVAAAQVAAEVQIIAETFREVRSC